MMMNDQEREHERHLVNQQRNLERRAREQYTTLERQLADRNDHVSQREAQLADLEELAVATQLRNAEHREEIAAQSEMLARRDEEIANLKTTLTRVRNREDGYLDQIKALERRTRRY